MATRPTRECSAELPKRPRALLPRGMQRISFRYTKKWHPFSDQLTWNLGPNANSSNCPGARQSGALPPALASNDQGRAYRTRKAPESFPVERCHLQEGAPAAPRREERAEPAVGAKHRPGESLSLLEPGISIRVGGSGRAADQPWRGSRPVPEHRQSAVGGGRDPSPRAAD